jgi:hypothetical protein
MMIVLLGVGIGVVVAGLLAVVFGFEVKEFSLGSTLILSGAVAVSTGLIMLSLATVVRELRAIAERLGPAAEASATRGKRELLADSEAGEEPVAEGPSFLRGQLGRDSAEPVEPPPDALPWQQEVARDRARQRGTPPMAAEPEPEAMPRRNLSFSSSSRKDRDRAAARAPGPFADDLNFVTPAQATMPVPSLEPGPPTSFEDAWPPSEPIRSDPVRRGARRPPAFNDANTGAPSANDRSQVTILKSGVVDGMAYSLYSDGSIEAQMPEGMMRFASIDELRAHLDQR